MSSFSSLQSFPRTTERSTQCIRRNTNQVISNGVCKCIWEHWHSFSSTAGKQAANQLRLAAAWPPCLGLLWELREEVPVLWQGVDGLWLLPTPRGQSHRGLWVLLLLCCISTVFDNRKASRWIAVILLLALPKEPRVGAVSDWAGADQFLLSCWKKLPAFTIATALQDIVCGTSC